MNGTGLGRVVPIDPALSLLVWVRFETRRKYVPVGFTPASLLSRVSNRTQTSRLKAYHRSLIFDTIEKLQHRSNWQGAAQILTEAATKIQPGIVPVKQFCQPRRMALQSLPDTGRGRASAAGPDTEVRLGSTLVKPSIQ